MKTVFGMLMVVLFAVDALAAKPNLKLPFGGGETWGITTGYGGSDYHQGKDYYAIDFNLSGNSDLGRPIVAAADGNIVFADWRDGYGWTVEIDHGNGYVTRYAHFEEKSQISGYILQGEQIGKCGMSGGTSTGSHLHFVLYHKNASGVLEPEIPEPMSGYTNFTLGEEYTSDNYGVLVSAGRYSDGTICEPIQEAYDQNGGVSVLGTPAFCLNPYSDGYVTSWPLLSYVLFQVFDGGSLGECAIVYDTQASPDHAFVMHGQLWEYYQAYNGPLLLLANQAIGGPIGPERSGTNNVNGHSLAVQRMAHGYLIYDTVTGFLDVNTSSSGFTIAMIPGDGESLTLRGWPQSTTSIYLVSNLNSKSEIIHAKGRSALPTGRQALAENPKQITMDQILNPKKYSLS